MKLLTTTIARILVGIPFFTLGAMHFPFANRMVEAIPSWLPGGIFWIYFTGSCLVLAGISLFINKYTSLACKLLAELLFIFILFVHIPNIMDPATQGQAMIGLLKDIGLMGAALTWAGISDRNYS
jgi:putative oxidoreductase